MRIEIQIARNGYVVQQAYGQAGNLIVVETEIDDKETALKIGHAVLAIHRTPPVKVKEDKVPK